MIQCDVPEWFRNISDWFLDGTINGAEMSNSLWWLVQENLAKCMEMGSSV